MSVITDLRTLEHFGSIRLEDTGYVFRSRVTHWENIRDMLAAHGWEMLGGTRDDLHVRELVRPFPRRSTLTPPGFPDDALLTAPDIAADWWYEHDEPEKAERVRLRQWIPDRTDEYARPDDYPLGIMRTSLGRIACRFPDRGDNRAAITMQEGEPEGPAFVAIHDFAFLAPGQ